MEKAWHPSILIDTRNNLSIQSLTNSTMMEKENIEEKQSPIPDNLEVFHVEEGYYKTIIPDRFKNRKTKVPPQSNIVAQIPGKIGEIFVKESQKIKAGERLMMLEAMKMNNILTCPFSGTVRTILIETGAVVPKGELLMIIDPA